MPCTTTFVFLSPQIDIVLSPAASRRLRRQVGPLPHAGRFRTVPLLGELDGLAGRVEHGGLRNQLGGLVVFENGATLIRVGAVEADDDRRVDVDAAERSDDAVGNVFALGD